MRITMEKKTILLFLLLITFLTAGCGGNRNQSQPASQPDSEKITVITTIFPLYDFTRNIGGDRLEVKTLIPPGSEPHSWEPTPEDMINISRADLFIFSGGGLETWIDKMVKNIESPRPVIVPAIKNISTLTTNPEEHHHETTSEGKHAEHDHEGTVDPHIWLDPVNAKIMVDNILAGLIGVDPQNKDYYTANARAYKEKLDQLHLKYQSALSGVKGKAFVTSHAAFGYLANRYEIEQIPIRGLSPETEPNPARMVEVVKLVKSRGIKYIFFETLVSPKISETIARETGAGTLVLNPIGGLTGEEINQGKDYISMMEQNLVNLKIALEVE